MKIFLINCKFSFVALLFILGSCVEIDRGPVPTEISEDGEGNSSAARKAWVESMHRTAPDVDWRDLEHQTAMERHAKRAAKRSEISTRSTWEELIVDKYRGKWSERGSKNQAGSVFDTEFDPEVEEIWLISAGGTLFKGDLNGQEWSPVNEDLRFNRGLLKLTPTDAGRNMIAYLNRKPHYSTDDGLTWHESSGFESLRATSNRSSIVLNNDNKDIFILTSVSEGQRKLMTSIDQGVSYNEVHTIDGDDLTYIFSPIGATDQMILWEDRSGEDIIYRIDENRILEEIKHVSNTGIEMRQILGHVSNDTLRLTTYDIVDRVYTSKDTGATWQEISQLPVSPWSVGMYQSPSDPDVMIIGDIECYVSRDGGVTWDLVHTWWEYYDDVDGKLHADMMHFKEFEDETGEPFLLISNHGGLNISRDKLQTVNNLSLQNLNVSQYYDVISSPDFPGWIFGGSQDQGFQRGRGLPEENINMEQVISGDYGHMVFGDDVGTMWMVYPFGSISIYNDVVNDPYTDDNYEIESNDEFIWINPTSSIKQEGVNGIYVAGGNINGGDGSYLIKLTYNSVSRFISAEQIDYNFKEFTDEGLISAIEVSPINPDVIYVATSNGRLFYTYDGGDTWEQNINFIPDGHYLYGQNVLASEKDENKVWLAGSGYSNPAVYYSENGGETFTSMSDGLPETLVFEIAMDAEETFMLAATESGPYLYLFEDEQWYDIAGVTAPNQTYWSVEYLEEDKIARFGTHGRGIWDVELDDLRVVSTDNLWSDQEVRIFPNPVNDRLNIISNLTTRARVNLSIVDLQGRTVYSEQKNLSSGRDQITLDASFLHAGHYFLHLIGSEHRSTRKLIKL